LDEEEVGKRERKQISKPRRRLVNKEICRQTEKIGKPKKKKKVLRDSH